MKAKNGLMFMAGFLTSILTIILVLGITIGVLGTTKRVGDITRMSPTTEKLIDPNSELGKKTVLDAYKMLRKDLDKLGDVPLKDLKKKYGINLPEKFSGVLSFLDPSKLYEFSIRSLTQDTPKVVDALLDSFYVNKALENFGLLDTVKNSLPFDVIKNETTGLLYKKASELKSMLDKGELIDHVQKNVKFNEVTNMLGIDLTKDEKFKDIDFIKNISGKTIKEAIESFKNIGNELKVKDVAKFAGIDFMKDERFKDIPFFAKLNDKPVSQFLEATKNISSELTLGNILKIAKVDDSKLKILKEKNLLDKTIKEIVDDKDAILDSFVLSDLVDVDVAPYYEDPQGNYVMASSKQYVECDASAFDKLNGNRFRRESVIEDGKTVSKYFPNPTGSYLEYNFGYFTLYNPNKAEHASLKRYSLATSNEYSIIHPKNITATSELYTYNAVTKTFEAYASGQYDFLYQKKTASSKLLQRLFNTKLKKPDETIKELILADVIDINNDMFSDEGVVSSASSFDATAKYAIFENNRYSFVDVTLPNFKVKYDGKRLFKQASVGTSEKLLKLLSFVSFENGAQSLNSFLETATLREFTDIEFDKYELDTDGDFVFEEEGTAGHYVPYNAAVHGSTDRYKRTYKSPTNSVLKRASSTKLNSISNLFNNLLVGEVLDIKSDVFKLSTSPAPDRKYYKYDGGVYTLLDTWSNPCYEKVKIGDSHAVLKKLALVKFNDLSSMVDNILKNVFLDELFDLTPYNIVDTEGTKDRKFVEQYNRYANNGYTFIQDAGGNYVESDVLYEKANSLQLGGTETVTFKWVTAKDYVEHIVSSGETPANALERLKREHLYVLDNGQYHFNRPWALYRLNKNLTSLENSDVFVRLASSHTLSGVAGSATAYTGKNLVLYNPIDDKYVAYDKTNVGLIGHDDLVYYEYKDGYYKYDKDNSRPAPLSELYKVDASGNYIAATSLADPEQLYFKHSSVGTTKLYFASISDTAIDHTHLGSVKYKMVGCSPVLKPDVNGEYKLFDNQLSKLNGEAYSGTKYSVLYGYVSDYAETGPSFLTTEVRSVAEKSLHLLTSLSKKRANLNNMNDVMSFLTLEELFDLPPNSIFAHHDLKTSTLTNLPDKFKTLMSSMSIADLCNYGEYTINNVVFNSLGKIKIDKFMQSLDVDNSGLVIDHDKLFRP